MVEEGYERRSFDYVIDKIDESIRFITENSGCDSYELFITGKDNVLMQLIWIDLSSDLGIPGCGPALR